MQSAEQPRVTHGGRAPDTNGMSCRRVRLAAVATHPIQYHAPLFRRLAGRSDIEFRVFFAHRPTAPEQGEGFGVPFQWDVDLTSGFACAWLRNRARRPSVTRFAGCNTPDVGRVLAAARVDALLAMGWNSLSLVQAILAARRRGIPVLVRGDSHLETPRSAVRRVVKSALYPWWVGGFAACLAVGARSAEYFAHYGAKRIVQCPHCIDNAWFAQRAAAEASRRAELRRGWGCAPDLFTFLFVGKLQNVKRPLDAIEGLRQCRALGVDAQLLVIGDGTLRRACSEAAARAALPVQFAGFVNQSDMPAAYAAGDALVLPSESETWGLAVNEAMACGLPAIASDRVGCVPDLLRDATGFVYPCGDVEALGGQMARLASAPAAARAMGTAARRVVAEYSVERAERGVLEGLWAAGFPCL